MRELIAVEASGFVEDNLWNKVAALIVVFVFISYGVASQELVSDSYDQALYYCLDLKPRSSNKLIQSATEQDKDYFLWQSLQNWNYVMEVVIAEDQSRYEAYLQYFETAMDRLTARQDELRSKPGYHFMLAEMNFLSGMTHVAYGDYLKGFKKIVKGNKYLKTNTRDYPDYWQNDKLNGILNVGFDSLPSFFKWVVKLFGVSGSADAGFIQLSNYLETTAGYKGLNAEAQLYKVFAYKLYNNEPEAYAFLRDYNYPAKNPTLLLYIKTNILYKTHHNEEAFSLLSSWSEDNAELDFYHFSYLAGKIHMNKLSEKAPYYLEEYLRKSKSSNFKREVNLLLAHYWLMNGDNSRYEYFLGRLKECPEAKTDRDREADVEAMKGYKPQIELLECSYLLNGGYYLKSSYILNAVNPSTFEFHPYEVEFYLLKGIQEAGMNSYGDALKNFDIVIQKGKDEDDHYAASAALLAGNTVWEQGEWEKAEAYWKMSKKIKGAENVYMENIHKKANIQLKKIHAN